MNLKRTTCSLVLFVAASLPCLTACSETGTLTAAEHGQRIYMANCAICHNSDPTQPGSQGPPIAGSSRALVEARVVAAAYPPGYAPKRATRVMPALPMLAADVDDLTAFLDGAVQKH